MPVQAIKAYEIMKKLTLLLLTLCLTQFVSAQDSPFRFGITGKPLFSWFKAESQDADKIDEVSNDGVKIGFSYGLFAEYQFAENYSVEFNINHLLYQGSYKVNYTDAYEEQKINNGEKLLEARDWNLQYIELPVTMRMKTNEIGYWTYFGKFGLAPAINVKDRGTNKFAVRDNEEDVPIDASLFNASVIIGGGAMYSLGGNTYLNGGLTFHNGLVDIETSDSYNIKPAFISLDLGILF